MIRPPNGVSYDNLSQCTVKLGKLARGFGRWPPLSPVAAHLATLVHTPSQQTFLSCRMSLPGDELRHFGITAVPDCRPVNQNAIKRLNGTETGHRLWRSASPAASRTSLAARSVVKSAMARNAIGTRLRGSAIRRWFIGMLPIERYYSLARLILGRPIRQNHQGTGKM